MVCIEKFFDICKFTLAFLKQPGFCLLSSVVSFSGKNSFPFGNLVLKGCSSFKPIYETC